MTRLRSSAAVLFFAAVLAQVPAALASRVVVAGGLASEATDFTADLLSKKFSRDQEREADELGVTRMLAAGYNPQGAVRMHRHLLEAEAGPTSFLSSHPGGEERMAKLEAFIAQSGEAKAIADKPQVALIARGKVAAGDRPPDELVDGISLERYAAVSNAVAASGNADGTYEKLGIARERYASVAEKWNERVRQDPSGSLGKRYSAAYLDASTGRFALHGKSAAMMLRGEPVADDSPPPISAADYVRIMKLMMRGGIQLKDALAQHKMTPYEWHIVQSWWAQRLVQDEAARSDFATAMSAKEPD